MAVLEQEGAGERERERERERHRGTQQVDRPAKALSLEPCAPAVSQRASANPLGPDLATL